MKKYLIYALQDPLTYEIRYIGNSGSGLCDESIRDILNGKKTSVKGYSFKEIT